MRIGRLIATLATVSVAAIVAFIVGGGATVSSAMFH